MSWNRKHLLDIESLTVDEIMTVLDTARAFKAVGERAIKKVPALRGKTVVNLFVEPSTRTRISFELSEQRLSADIINFTAEASSLKKGETLKDTARNLEALNTDFIVIRHSASGAPSFLARVLNASVINAGDGAHEHPTQALLDMFTIRERKGRIEGLNVTILGDILYSRVARSNIWALTKLGAHVTLCGPSTLVPREFEQMEIEFFCKPDESMKWYEFWRDARIKWYESLGIKSDKLRPRQQGTEELAHYSKACTDIEYLFPFSDEPQELEGVAHRGSFDLNQHGKFSRNDENAFAVIDEDTPTAAGEKKEKYVPHVIEPSAGADRFTLAVICEAYSYDESRASPEFMKFHPRLAPIKAAVFPLVAKDGLPEIAEPIYREIKRQFPCQYDAKQSIGKRYARMDEAGTPFCFTIDGQSKEDGTVTVRNRDDATQIRIDKTRCLQYLRDKLGL